MGGPGGLPKNYSDEGGGRVMRKKSEIGGGGVIQFSNYTSPNPTSPPYPIKNERSLITEKKSAIGAVVAGVGLDLYS